jgi:hypothetical protein
MNPMNRHILKSGRVPGFNPSPLERFTALTFQRFTALTLQRFNASTP